MDKNKVAEWYDNFSSKQEKTGVNARHRTILKKLKASGLKNNYSVLEIGCGIGTVTGLLAAYLRNGRVMATDISPRSVEMAKKKLSQKSNVEFFVGDVAQLPEGRQYDVVVLPDVLEHIPIEEHKALFKAIRDRVHDNSFVAIHLPDPHYQEWLKLNKPELLQIIDQPVHTDQLLRDAYANDLHLHFMEAYSLFINDPNYQWIILKPNREFRPGGPGKVANAIRNYKIRIG